ncbi:ABC transporter permease [bacterium]|nr:ABC transporter permease [bacterium]
MIFPEAVRSAFASMLDRKARVALNVLGVAIGTGAVVLLVAMGGGARDAVLNEFNAFGSGIVVAQPGHTETLGFSPSFAGNNMPITVDDALAVARRVPGIEHSNPVAAGTARVEAKPRGRHVQVAGVTSEWVHVWNVPVIAGTFLPPADPKRGPRVACLGAKLARELFPRENPLGRFVRIGGTRFRVIGVISKQLMLGLDLDDMAYITVDRGMKLFDQRGLMSLEMSGGPGADSRELKAEVTAVLKARHRNHVDFTVISQDDMLDTLSTVLGAITKGLAAIAAISLVVSGVGIANTMLVTVNERRSEVGLKLALGATPGVVLFEFLVEAVAIAGTGSFLGLGAAVLAAGPLGRATLGVPAPTPPWILLLAAGVALVLGVGAGIWPARSASRIPPAEALREE